MYHNYSLTTPNAIPIEINVSCLKSTSQFYFFLRSKPCNAAYPDKAWAVLFQKQVRYGFTTQTDFDLHPLARKTVTTVQIRLKFILFHRPDTHPFSLLYPCQIITKQLYLISCMKAYLGW